jgi:hypothetical protein
LDSLVAVENYSNDRFEPDMLAFSGCYYGGGEKERYELGEIRKRWATLPVSSLSLNIYFKVHALSCCSIPIDEKYHACEDGCLLFIPSNGFRTKWHLSYKQGV